MNDDSLPPPLPTQPPVRRRGLGCFAKGCLLTITVLMIFGVGIGTLGFFLIKSGQAYFTEQPVPTRIFDATDDQYQAVLAKLQPFAQAMNEGRAATVELTTDDLNTLIARLPQFAPLRGHVYVNIVGGQLLADLSFPTTRSDAPNQYFVSAHATLDASFASGRFTFALRHAAPLQGEAKDGLLPSMLRNPTFLQNYSEMINRNANDFVHDESDKDLQIADILSKLRMVVLTGDKLVATSVERPALPTPTPEPTVSPVASPAKTE